MCPDRRSPRPSDCRFGCHCRIERADFMDVGIGGRAESHVGGTAQGECGLVLLQAGQKLVVGERDFAKRLVGALLKRIHRRLAFRLGKSQPVLQ
jgi:hypothetical protein